MKKFKSCLLAVSLIACAFSFTPATAAPVDSSPPITADHIAPDLQPTNGWLPSLANVVPFYANALNIEQATPVDRWRDIIAPIALAFAACAYLAKRYRSLGSWIRYHLARARDRARDRWLRTYLRLKLVARSILALVFERPHGLCTANIKTDPATGPLPGEEAPAPDSEVGLLIKGAEVDWKDVTWRIRAGLTPKQAVEVAINEKREAADQQPNELSPVEVATLKKGQPIGAAAPATGATATAAAEPLPDNFETMKAPQLKKLAASRNVDITGLRKNDDIRAAINKSSSAKSA